CRSCIVKYLECNKYCPRCKSYNSKPITVANLRPDRTLRALVYKLVPGLHKSENQRIVQFYASISSNIVSSEDDPAGQGTFQLLDDQNFFSPDEPISLSLEYHYDTLEEHNAAGAQLPVTYLQCPAAVTVHHLYKFILTKNGLQVGSDNIRVEIIYEEEILPHDFTLMDVAYCFDYKRIAPMRFFYRILIHSAAKLAPGPSAYHHRVEGQDKNSTGASPNEAGHASKSTSPNTTLKATPTADVSGDGQRPNSSSSGTIRTKEESADGRAPRDAAANNSAPKAAVNGHQQRTKSSPTTAATSSDANGTGNGTKPSPSGLKMVLVPKCKQESSAGAGEAKRSPPPLKAIQQPAAAVNGSGKAAGVSGKERTASEAEKSPTNSTLKCYVNLKTQTVVGGPSPVEAVPPSAPESNARKPSPTPEIPRLKIDLKAKLSIPREKTPGLSPPSSSNSSAATSPSSATSSAGKSPVWPMGKEEYAKTIGLKPVYAATVPETPAEGNSNGDGSSHSSSHRKRKKGKHSKEAGGSGKRRKLHAEISSQHDASLKMKVKITEKPPKHERRKSSGVEEEGAPSKSPPAAVPEPVPSPPKAPKVIDITKDDDEVKFVKEQKSVPPPKDVLQTAAASSPAKDKLNEMRNVRHKPMVYIPNLDRSLSADLPGVSTSINSLLESVGAKAPPVMKPTPALIPASTATSVSKSQPRAAILSRPMPSCPPLAYPMTSSPVTGSTTGSIRTVAAPPAIKRSISADSNSSGASPKMPRLEPPSLMAAPVALLPSAKQSAPIQAPMFNFAKGANRAKAAQQAAGMIAASSQPEHHHVPYRSPISASYTKEIPTTKKPVPNLLLPPATVSVTKMSDIMSSTSTSSAGQGNSRPAVEILRIPPTAPVADKPTLAPFVTPKVTTKTTRPPPATIPLIKIKKPTSTGAGELNPPGMTPLRPPKLPTVRTASEPSSSGNSILDLSGGTGGAATASRHLTDEVIILDHSPVKANRSYAPVKRPPEIINFTSAATILSQGLPTVQKTLAPIPKLTEINRHRSLTVRQPNASIRSIPNPSALAFRGAPTVPPSSSSSFSSSSSSSSSFSSTTSGSLMSGFGTTGGQQTNRSNGSGTLTSSLTTVKSATSLSNGSAAARALMGPAKSEASKPPAINGATAANSSTSSSINNNNNSKIANANTGLAAKKTIEKVAAVLKAAAATADTVTTPPSGTTSSSGSNTKDESRGKSPRKEDFNSSAPSGPVAAASSASGATATTAANRVKTHADSIVTSAVTTPSLASVTGTNGGSPRNSPASIVNVG
uniref:RAWUL domain-containing protein n=1 Tax=Anopheles epiroticus TaxID=199890 RepID=A0A182PEU5_9DIPT